MLHKNCRNYLNHGHKFRRKLWDFWSSDRPTLNSTRLISDIRRPQNILFFGTDNFSLPSLKALHKNSESSLSGVAVVTSYKNPMNCIRKYAIEEKLSLNRWPITPSQCEGYDLGVVVSFGHLIPSDIIQAFPLGMINVHASLLPRWRGAAPIIYAILNNDTKTGVSIMQIQPHHFDVGDILAQREVQMKKNIFMPELHTELANAGATLLVETVNNFSEYSKNARKQNSDLATYAPKITDNITEVNWTTMTAEQIFRYHRAMYGYKALTTTYENRNVELLDVRLPMKLFENAPILPGGFVYKRESKSLLMCCADQSYLEVLQLRIEGKKAMSASDFNNGFLRQSKVVQPIFRHNKKLIC